MTDPAVSHVGQRLHSLWLCALFKRSLLIQCRSCPNLVIVSAQPLWWRFKRARWPEDMPSVPRRFFCRNCWGSHIKKVRPRVTITLDDPTTDLGLPWPNEREWRRMVSRFRS